MNSQPNDPVTQDMALPVRSSIFFGATTPQTTKATARAAATAKTTRSTGGPFRDFTSPSDASSVDSDTVLVIGPPSSGGLRLVLILMLMLRIAHLLALCATVH